jgi:predicted MFS family arabinose efflux permease
VRAGVALRTTSFWLLSGAFVLASIATVAMTVHAIPFLLEGGHSATFAAFAVGLIGVSQIPGRLLFAPLAALLPRPLSIASVFVLIAVGVGVVVTMHSTAAVLSGLVLLGMGNGMATLARATSIADLYGSAAYGTIASVAGAMTTTARAVGPVAAALYAAAFGYVALLWTLAGLACVAAMLAYRATA